MEASLREMDQKLSPGLDDLMILLRRRIALSKSFYILIDALDECEAAERRALLDALSLLSTATSGVRILVASRESLSVELRRRFPRMGHISMASVEACSEISLYVEEVLQERRRNETLVVGEPSLFDEIKDILIQHADGMYVPIITTCKGFTNI